MFPVAAAMSTRPGFALWYTARIGAPSNTTRVRDPGQLNRCERRRIMSHPKICEDRPIWPIGLHT